MDIKSLFGFENKNVVITGAGSGMGYAAAKLLVELGANVYATTRRNKLDFAVTKEISANLSSQEGIDDVVRELPDQIDALFICHGISNSLGKTNALEVQLTNFYSFKYLTEKLLPNIVDEGSVTFISSDGGKDWRSSLKDCLEIMNTSSWEEAADWYEKHPQCTGDGYVFSKKCQNAYVFAKCHAPEFINRKIRINAIAPGMTKTGLTDDFNKSITGDAVQGQAILEKINLEFWNGRWASPEEMGYPMVAVGSKIFSYMSGQVIYINYGTASLWEIGELQKK